MTPTTLFVTNAPYIQWMADGTERLGRITSRVASSIQGRYIIAQTADEQLHRIDMNGAFKIVPDLDPEYPTLDHLYTQEQNR